VIARPLTVALSGALLVTPGRLAAQRAGECLEATYQPDSLAGVLPARVALGAHRERSDAFVRGVGARRVRWRPAPDGADGRALWRLTRGRAVWYAPRADSLVVNLSEVVVLRLRRAGMGAWRGVAYMEAGDFDRPATTTAAAVLRRVGCVAADTGG